jgi:hypothetical protein
MKRLLVALRGGLRSLIGEISPKLYIYFYFFSKLTLVGVLGFGEQYVTVCQILFVQLRIAPQNPKTPLR